MPDKTIALCMRIYDWDQCRLLEHFTEKTPDQFYDHAKVISPFHKKTLKRKRTYDCGICFESISRLVSLIHEYFRFRDFVPNPLGKIYKVANFNFFKSFFTRLMMMPIECR